MKMGQHIFLKTDRLILRKLREEDFGDFCEYAMDHDMSRMMGRDQMETIEDARRCFDWLLFKEERGYALVLRETGKVIGNLTVYNSTAFMEECPELKGRPGRSLSFSLSKRYQRKGLMFEAIRAVIDHLFQFERIDFIQCGHFSFNIASAALQKKLGFVPLASEQIILNDEEIEVIENVLWRDEWHI